MLTLIYRNLWNIRTIFFIYQLIY